MLCTTTMDWIHRLTNAHATGRLDAEPRELGRYGLVIVDEVGYLLFDQEAANLFFRPVRTRYEKTVLILPSNLPHAGWGEVFGTDTIAAGRTTLAGALT